MTTPATHLKPGDRMPDGTIYTGISPETFEAMYAMPADAPLTMTFNDASDYAKKLNQEKYLGHDDWRVPTGDELNVLFNNRAAIGGFNVSGSHLAGWYWSTSPDVNLIAWCQRFSDGATGFLSKATNSSSVRLVRSEGRRP